MARDERNWDNFLYVDDNGVSWTKRGDAIGATTAVDGHATSTSAPLWIDGPRMRARKITYKDLTTGRTITRIFYTAAAYAAVALGATVTVLVKGLTTGVTYTADSKHAEFQGRRGTTTKLPDA